MAQALSVKDATFIGGGTDIMPLLKNHVRDDRFLVFTGRLPELQGIHAEGGTLFIGAGVALFDIACDETVRAVAGALARAAALTASPQIRNIATIGGNVMQDRRCIYFNQSRFWRSAPPLPTPPLPLAGEVHRERREHSAHDDTKDDQRDKYLNQGERTSSHKFRPPGWRA